MTISARLRHLRIAPRKVRLVADLVRGKKVEEAQKILNFTVRGASRPLFKLLKQAEANAKNNFQLDPTNLYIAKITVDEGPKLKRWMPRARGQTYEIQKKTSHITLILDELTPGKKAAKKMKKDLPAEEIKTKDKIIKTEKPKQKTQIEAIKPKSERGIRRIFRRKAI